MDRALQIRYLVTNTGRTSIQIEIRKQEFLAPLSLLIYSKKTILWIVEYNFHLLQTCFQEHGKMNVLCSLIKSLTTRVYNYKFTNLIN